MNTLSLFKYATILSMGYIMGHFFPKPYYYMEYHFPSKWNPRYEEDTMYGYLHHEDSITEDNARIARNDKYYDDLLIKMHE